jgi:hypothetical protein
MCKITSKFPFTCFGFDETPMHGIIPPAIPPKQTQYCINTFIIWNSEYFGITQADHTSLVPCSVPRITQTQASRCGNTLKQQLSLRSHVHPPCTNLGTGCLRWIAAVLFTDQEYLLNRDLQASEVLAKAVRYCAE